MSIKPNLLILLTLIVIIGKHVAVEYIYNIGQNRHKICGKDDDCSIVCDDDSSCKDSIFEVYNSDITIQCSNVNSCDHVTIVAINVSSLNLTFSGYQSFFFGEVFVDISSKNIHTECTGDYACWLSKFHYESQSHITHYCNGFVACSGPVIHVLGDVNITIYCEGTLSVYPCSRLVVILPTLLNKNNVNIIATGDVAGNGTWSKYDPMYVLSLYRINPHSIICKDECSLDNIWILYGIQFDIDNSCKASNKTCIQQMPINDNNNTIIIDTYIDDLDTLDFSDVISDNVLLILWESGTKDLNAPIMNNVTTSFSLLCFPCKYMNISLERTQNAVVTAFWGFITDTVFWSDPHESFIFNQYGIQARNTYWLFKTKSIRINGIRNYYTNEHADAIQIYLGYNNPELEIICNFVDSCNNLFIFSWNDPTYTNTYNRWNIECNGPNTCIDFYLYFEIYSYYCLIDSDDPLYCLNVLQLQSNDYNISEYNNNIDIIYIINDLKNNQQDALINNGDDSIERTNILLKMSYLNAWIDLFSIRNSSLLQFTDFIIVFNTLSEENTDDSNSLKIESTVKSINNLVKSNIYVISDERVVFIDSATQVFRQYFHNSLLNVDFIIVEASLITLPIWVAPLALSFGSLLIFIIIIEIIKYIYRKLKEEYISNPLILLIGIAEYDNDISDQDANNAIRVNIQTLTQLFTNLNYQTIVEADKLNWTKNEFMSRLEFTGNILGSYDNYDSLIVVILCYGIKNYIITSDQILINKDAIHRLFSINYPKTRNIPRIFCFVSCDCTNLQLNQNAYTKGKNVELGNIRGNKSSSSWNADQQNPDYKLVKIDAVNLESNDFNIDLINEFKERMEESIINNIKCWKRNKNIDRIFSNIQQYLNKKGTKTQIINTFNSNTSYLIFKKNTQSTQKIDIEMIPILDDDDDHDDGDDKTFDDDEKLINSKSIINEIKKLLSQNKDKEYIKRNLALKYKPNKQLNELIDGLILFIKGEYNKYNKEQEEAKDN